MSEPHILNADELVRKALMDGTRDLLEECTSDQVEFFHKIQNSASWKGLDNCPPNQLRGAYELARRTVIKNRAGRAPKEGAS